MCYCTAAVELRVSEAPWRWEIGRDLGRCSVPSYQEQNVRYVKPRLLSKDFETAEAHTPEGAAVPWLDMDIGCGIRIGELHTYISYSQYAESHLRDVVI